MKQRFVGLHGNQIMFPSRNDCRNRTRCGCPPDSLTFRIVSTSRMTNSFSSCFRCLNLRRTRKEIPEGKKACRITRQSSLATIGGERTFASWRHRTPSRLFEQVRRTQRLLCRVAKPPRIHGFSASDVGWATYQQARKACCFRDSCGFSLQSVEFAENEECFCGRPTKIGRCIQLY